MEINTKYNIGDKIWYAHGFSYSYQVTCTCCNATGSLVLANGKTAKCGECHNGEHRVHKPHKFRPQSGTIKEVEFSTRGGVKYLIDTYNFSMEEKDILPSFLEARKEARGLNKKYGWPKENFDRHKEGGPFINIDYPNRCYWGVRLRKNLNHRNVE